MPLLVNQGLFSVNLGDTGLSNMTAVIPPSIFTNSDVRLRIWFSDGVAPFQQFYPDQRLTAVGYAMMTASVPDGAITGAKLAQGAVGTDAVGASAISGANSRTGPLQPEACAGRGEHKCPCDESYRYPRHRGRRNYRYQACTGAQWAAMPLRQTLSTP